MPLGWLPFTFVLRRDGREVSAYRPGLGKLRDHYVLDVAPDLAEVDSAVENDGERSGADRRPDALKRVDR